MCFVRDRKKYEFDYITYKIMFFFLNRVSTRKPSSRCTIRQTHCIIANTYRVFLHPSIFLRLSRRVFLYSVIFSVIIESFEKCNCYLRNFNELPLIPPTAFVFTDLIQWISMHFMVLIYTIHHVRSIKVHMHLLCHKQTLTLAALFCFFYVVWVGYHGQTNDTHEAISKAIKGG